MDNFNFRMSSTVSVISFTVDVYKRHEYDLILKHLQDSIRILQIPSPKIMSPFFQRKTRIACLDGSFLTETE